jgi:hypothetical protein
MGDWIEEASAKVDEFFEDLSDEELDEALDQADYDFYKSVDFPVIALSEKTQRASFRRLQRVLNVSGRLKSSSSPEEADVDNRGYTRMVLSDSKKAADDHTYAMAA